MWPCTGEGRFVLWCSQCVRLKCRPFQQSGCTFRSFVIRVTGRFLFLDGSTWAYQEVQSASTAEGALQKFLSYVLAFTLAGPDIAHPGMSGY